MTRRRVSSGTRCTQWRLRNVLVSAAAVACRRGGCLAGQATTLWTGPVHSGQRRAQSLVAASRLLGGQLGSDFTPALVPPVRRHQLRRCLERHAIFTEFMEEMAERPNVFFGEIAVVVLLSTGFEKIEKWIRREMKETGDETGQKILDSLFKEITGLGYIGFLLYVTTRSGLADQLAESLLGKGNTEGTGPNLLSETFETVHIMIFMLLTVLLFQAAAVSLVSRQVSITWDTYERTRAFGTASDSLETKFAEAGFIERVADPTKPRGTNLELRKKFTYGDDWLARFRLRGDPLYKLVMWRAIRHEFLFPNGAYKQAPNPGFFSFTTYLIRRLGKTALALVEVDVGTWFLTLMLLVPLVYFCTTLDFVAIEVVQCVLAWSLLAFTWLLTVVLEEETFQLTPQVPEDPRQILRLLGGTSSSTMRYKVIMEGTTGTAAPVLGLGGCEDLPSAKLSRPPAFRAVTETDSGPVLPSRRFLPSALLNRALRAVGFWQAISVTSLIISFLSEPPEGWLEISLYTLAWVEWPIMLFVLVPVLLRRLTIRNSIEGKKEDSLIREVGLETKQGLLRDYVRLVQLGGFERRAVESGEPWALSGHANGTGGVSGDTWSFSEAKQRFEHGLEKFRRLPQNMQLDIWKIFASWDADNNATVDVQEFSQVLKALGYEDLSERASSNLLRLVDYDGTNKLTWRKFKAMMMLAIAERPLHETEEDLDTFFRLIDTDGDKEISVFELADWSKNSKIGMDEDDFSTLLYKFFQWPKPTITREEFIEWVKP